jgi:membrane-bound ClpP family serine protease
MAPAVVRTINSIAERSRYMLWTVLAIILILWLLGFLVADVGSLVHLLLIVALVVLIVQLLTGRRAV